MLDSFGSEKTIDCTSKLATEESCLDDISDPCVQSTALWNFQKINLRFCSGINKMSTPDSYTRGYIRCYTCKRKLNLVEQSAGQCKCNQVFCAKHRCVRKPDATQTPQTPRHSPQGSPNPQDKCHPCSFDYLSEQKHLLTMQNPAIKVSKLKFT